MLLKIQHWPSIGALDVQAWDALAGDNPFLRHAFLSALERSGCIGRGTAWQPAYLTASDHLGVAGAMLLFIKFDSLGEFVFDWSWADAYERAGRSYYPKLVAAVPFTPATGPRMLLREGADAAVRAALLEAARESVVALDASSLHVLFPTEQETEALEAEGLLARKSCQFHWHNDGYQDFEEFLSRFSSAKRKKAKRERRRIAEAGITFDHLRGDEPSAADWDTIFECYSRTFAQHGRPPYLNREFFDEIATTMPEHLVLVVARLERTPIATAICFRGGDTLYGRYWGAVDDFHSLHFETCYYQGIDYCIRSGLQRFEPGTQGEHKISRGFTPQPTWSYHWLRDSSFHAAVANFLRRETRHVDAYMNELDEHLPYREPVDGSTKLSFGDGQ
jgi:predicted N-acyltransferase